MVDIVFTYCLDADNQVTIAQLQEDVWVRIRVRDNEPVFEVSKDSVNWVGLTGECIKAMMGWRTFGARTGKAATERDVTRE